MMLGEKVSSPPQRTPATQVMVSGQGLLSVLEAMSLIESHARKILASHGLDPIDGAQWYPFRNALDAFKVITERIGPSTMKSIGRKLLEHVRFSSANLSLEEALASLDSVYRICHRGPGYIGKYVFESTGARSAQVTTDNEYMCELDEGLLEALSERFKPPGALWVRVVHKPGSCRKQGNTTCTYEVSW
ncbi:hypothetical protein [Hyalangium rubrum]|uniref:Uncharacterized protein n=1 Tax=Hyalangium rubrum TaxID=3103134 RepID=A0ABU5H8D4_9BACT|nr:hypothetical protein [Hyalangium sp. s54d21]MDY7229556.1 hypothetical protein [Hyalangium sp. s54d21]